MANTDPVTAVLSASEPNTKLKPSCPQLMTLVTASDTLDTTYRPAGIFTSMTAIRNWAMTALTSILTDMFFFFQEIRYMISSTRRIPVRFNTIFICSHPLPFSLRLLICPNQSADCFHSHLYGCLRIVDNGVIQSGLLAFLVAHHQKIRTAANS